MYSSPTEIMNEDKVSVYRDLFDNAFDLLGVATPDGWFVDLNPSWERTLGFTREELLAAPYLSFVHPEDVDRTISEAKRAAEGGHVLKFRNRYRCKDGSYRWLDWTSTTHGDLIFFVARDATHAVHLEEALRSSLAQLRASAEAVQLMSTPILKVAEGVLLLPVIGRIDDSRASALMEKLLDAIVQSASSVTILDLTGVAEVSAESASHVLSLIRAAGLLGSRCLVSGIRPQIAATMVELGVEGANLQTFGTLTAALSHALGGKTGRRG